MAIIFGCGDVGRRIANHLMENGLPADHINAYVNTVDSAELCAKIKVLALRVDLDDLQRDLSLCNEQDLFYTVAPQKCGERDERSRTLLEMWEATDVRPRKVVLISTTGVYGDCHGEWVTESSATTPQTDRARRRLDSEKVWFDWGQRTRVPVVVLRVPGIYSYSRLPKDRLMKRTPVVRPEECGFTNRVHANDLARIAVRAMERGEAGEIFNATDGVPGKISEYLQEAATVLGMEPLPQISMEEAKSELSEGMLSYLNESRKISNQKMVRELGVELLYPNFKQGIRY